MPSMNHNAVMRPHSITTNASNVYGKILNLEEARRTCKERDLWRLIYMADKTRDEERALITSFFHDHQDELLADIERLVKIPSVVTDPLPGMPYGEAPYQALKTASAISERMGFHTKIEDDCCMTADYGDRPVRLCLLAHLDVVPAGSGWTKPPYALTKEGEKVFGRGVADNKGPGVALLYAMKAAKEIYPDLPYSPQVWFGTAEEIGSPDLKNYMKHTDMPPLCLTPDGLEPIVIGECAKYRPEFYAEWQITQVLPRITSLEGGKVRNAIPGYAEAVVAGLATADVKASADKVSEHTKVKFSIDDIKGGVHIKAEGRGAHIGRPELGRNAQTALVSLLASLPLADCPGTRAIRSLSRLFPYGDLAGTGLGLTVRDEIMGGTQTNFTVCSMTETEIRCKLDSRGPLAANPENYSSVIDKALQEGGFTVIPSAMDDAHYVPEDSPLVQKVKEIYEEYYNRPAVCCTSVGASYAHYIEGAVSTGVASPGVDTMLHKSDEFMFIKDLLLIGETYTRIILDICRMEQCSSLR